MLSFLEPCVFAKQNAYVAKPIFVIKSKYKLIRLIINTKNEKKPKIQIQLYKYIQKKQQNLNLLKQFTKNIDKYTDKCQLANTKTQR